MKNKILIFEDDETYFEIIYNELAKYDVDIFPAPGDAFDRFSDSMVYYASKPNEKNFNVIKDYVLEFNPNIVILDICFDENRSTDQSGMTVKNNLLDVEFPDAVVYYYSKRIKNFVDENLQIHKSAHLRADVKLKIADVFGLNLITSKQSTPSEQQVLVTTTGEDDPGAPPTLLHSNGTNGSGGFGKTARKSKTTGQVRQLLSGSGSDSRKASPGGRNLNVSNLAAGLPK